jgi:thioredoxin-related protein
VFTSSQFADYARKNLVLVQVDFPTAKKRQPAALKKANAALKDRFKIEGFPTVILLDSKGKKLGQEVGYDGSGPKPFLAKLEKMRKH